MDLLKICFSAFVANHINSFLLFFFKSIPSMVLKEIIRYSFSFWTAVSSSFSKGIIPWYGINILLIVGNIPPPSAPLKEWAAVPDPDSFRLSSKMSCACFWSRVLFKLRFRNVHNPFRQAISLIIKLFRLFFFIYVFFLWVLMIYPRRFRPTVWA